MASTSLDAKYPVQVLCRIADAPSSTQYQEVKEAIVHRSDCTKRRLYKEVKEATQATERLDAFVNASALKRIVLCLPCLPCSGLSSKDT